VLAFHIQKHEFAREKRGKVHHHREVHSVESRSSGQGVRLRDDHDYENVEQEQRRATVRHQVLDHNQL
jgi:hypothetical protein